MVATALKRVRLVWILPILATAASWVIGVRSNTGGPSNEVSADLWILLISGLKVWLVMDWFMELREATARVRWALRVWLIALLVCLLALAA